MKFGNASEFDRKSGVRSSERGAPVHSLYTSLNIPVHCLNTAVINGGTHSWSAATS
jgi:hypothetical protein